MMPEQHESLDPDNLAVGAAVSGGRFVIEACLGQGGVATVYRVRTVDGRRVALKLMVTKRAADGDQRERFENEWRIGRALHGLRYVVSVEESGRHDDGRPFFTMELVQAPTLADLVADRQLTVARACWIAREVADALDDLHTRGVVHRDIKPDNVMVMPEGIRLLDFGYAYTRGSEQLPPTAGLTSSEHRPGTLLYMAPEQVDGALPAPAFDIYALSATLHEALVGHAPYSDQPQKMMLLHKTRGADGEPSIDGRMVGLRRGLVELVDQGLRRNPSERVRSAAELRDRLDAVLEEMGDEDFPAGVSQRPVATAGELVEEDADEMLAFLPTHRRAREVPLRPAIGGGRGETKPVPAAVPVDAERSLDGLDVPEDLQVEAVDAGVDEKAELLALREAARRTAEREREAAVAEQAEQRAKQAEAEPEPSPHVDPDEAELRRLRELREASIEKEIAGQAKDALERAEAEVRRREATEKAPEREAAAKAAARKKGLAAAVLVLLLGGGVWWGLWGEREEISPVVVDAQPEPTKAPDPAREPAKQPELARQPEPKPAVEPPIEPAIAPKPEPSRKPKPNRKPKPPAPTPEPCTDVAAEANGASRGKKWSRVLQLTKSARCWEDPQARIELRVEALSELGRYAECSTLGATSKDPEVRRMAKSCAAQIDEEKSP